MNSLEELSTKICQTMESLEAQDKQLVTDLVGQLLFELSMVKSRFIDIDPSLKDDEEELRQQTQKRLESVFDSYEARELYRLYETLKSYLFMRVKHGEAADWFLKNEIGG